MYFHSRKKIAPFYLNDMFMLSLNNHNTKWRIVFDIPVEQVKVKDVVSSWKDVEYVKIKY